MSITRIVFIVLAALFLVPMVGTMGVQLVAGIFVAKTAYDVNQSITAANRGPDDPFGGKVNVVNAYEEKLGRDHRRLKAGYLTLAGYGDIDARRQAHIHVYARLEDLLKEGEELPEDDFIDVFLAARAPAVGQAECALLMETIARACRVDHARGTRVRDARDLHRIDLTLSFVARAQFGTFDANSPLYFAEFGAPLTKTDKKHGRPYSTFSNYRKARKHVYQAAAEACMEMRRREGNCAINGIRFQTNWDEKRRRIYYSANARLAWLSETVPADAARTGG